jgi:hypothetical protein
VAGVMRLALIVAWVDGRFQIKDRDGAPIPEVDGNPPRLPPSIAEQRNPRCHVTPGVRAFFPGP